MKYENIPEELASLPQWVCARSSSKIPFQAKVQQAASSSNPATWCDFETAADAVKSGAYEYLGFVFANNGIVGIDVDCGFDEDGLLSAVSVDIMRACRSYTEKSKSGRGVHIFVKGVLPFEGRNNRAGVEMYQSKRYFITTGEKLIYGDIIENQGAIDYVVSKYFPETEKEGTGGGFRRIYSPIYSKPENGKMNITPTYPPIPQGARNISLASLAGQLHNQGYEKKAIYLKLLEVNKTACTPPLPVEEIQAIVNSISRYRR